MQASAMPALDGLSAGARSSAFADHQAGAARAHRRQHQVGAFATVEGQQTERVTHAEARIAERAGEFGHPFEFAGARAETHRSRYVGQQIDRNARPLAGDPYQPALFRIAQAGAQIQPCADRAGRTGSGGR
jgi:hypothetical protein